MSTTKTKRKPIDYLKWFKDNGWTMGLEPVSSFNPGAADGNRMTRWYRGPRGGCPYSGGLNAEHWTEEKTAEILYKQEKEDARREARYQAQLKNPTPNTVYTHAQFIAAFVARADYEGESHDEWDREMNWRAFQANTKPYGHLTKWLKKVANQTIGA